MDLFHLPPSARANVDLYRYTGIASAYQNWVKPSGVSMVFMVTIAGGGGGGAGFPSAVSGSGGGGGGACSGISRFLCPAAFLPDELYIQVGNGGLGGVPGVSSGNASPGVNSFILTSKTAVLPNIICYSGVNAPGGGGGGATAAAGAAGTVPTIAVTQPVNALGEWLTIVGLVGAIGGVGAVGTAVTCWAAIPLSPGSGGAGVTAADFAGGAQTATAVLELGAMGSIPVAAGGVALGGNTSGAPHGSSGRNMWKPFLHSGGAGGAGIITGGAVGGDGGVGGIGCGGGGGGAGTTGGKGGHGGNGMVMIVSW